ncbi:MAG: dihydrodipicolinate synthase family protein [Planctomycetes bacterium]|nr:dihydrodipicolinate synthase family protein [Planctomycetota bacterium]
MANTAALRQRLLQGLVIPAHPLALDQNRKLDEKHQRALTRYYLAAGAGGLAVAVHTTQFQIRDPKIGLFKPVLQMAAEIAKQAPSKPVLVAGITGPTAQAVDEARTAVALGYDVGLLSLAAMKDATNTQLIAHCKEVAAVIPVFGFYLQPAVGGRKLDTAFWRDFAAIDNVVGIKFAPFNRYQTIDVVRGVVESGRVKEVALYTGNDDSIIVDLLSTYRFNGTEATIIGGLLGQWAVGTRAAVRILEQAKAARAAKSIPTTLLTLAHELTDTNAALFDVANHFHGCIAGIHEILVRQKVMPGRTCLDPKEDLSPGQMAEIDRVHKAYPHLHDDEFIKQHIDGWLK